ncbi:DUF6292 family protein [Streptomyces sp. NPDC057375]|uniref:DUF6292 family protein n=1 Tax=Streptomyces sp. NPDC057375 TaxID=3346109 RepID=UPI0036343B82
MDDEQMAKQLVLHVEHYLVAVAEHLMKHGVAISQAFSYGPYTEDGFVFTDVEGILYFSTRFARQLDGRGAVDLFWTATSGWCLGDLDAPAFPADCARWMGCGLLPEPERVAAFLDTYRLNPEKAGCAERPYYRCHGGLISLVQRLAAYMPPHTSADYPARLRFAAARDHVYSRRICKALNADGRDSIVNMPLRIRELDALLHLLEYAEVSSAGWGPDGFAGLLASALEARRAGREEAAERHSSALAEAAVRWQRIDELRNLRQHGGT